MNSSSNQSDDRARRASTDVWDSNAAIRYLYEPIYRLFGGNDAMISVLGTYVIMAIVYWGFNAFLLVADMYGWPRWMAKYKIQAGKNEPVDRARLWKALKVVAFNNLILNLVHGPFLYVAQQARGVPFAPEDCPTISQMLRQFLGALLIHECVFYYTHRLFHIPFFYNRVHKLHHEWTAPIGLVCIYATPFEYLIGNLPAGYLGPLVLKSHIFVWWVELGLGMMFTSVHHSGYHMPFLPSPQFHDYHHLTFNSNFGTIGLLDRLHGTDKGFRGTVQRKRHRTLWSLTRPISYFIPARAKKVDKATLTDDIVAEKKLD